MAKTPINHLTYQQIGRTWVERLKEPGLAICPGCDEYSQNTHYRGLLTGSTIHWSRTTVRRAGLHAFLRALFLMNDGLQPEYEDLWAASVYADHFALVEYHVRIPAHHSLWERRRVLALAERDGYRLRSASPMIYAWATYEGGSK